MQKRNSRPRHSNLFKFFLAAIALFGSLMPACSSGKMSKDATLVAPKVSKNAIDINEASADELQRIPNIGVVTAQRIVSHRSRFGRFRRVEHLMLVPGISDHRFRKLRSEIEVK